MYPFNILLTPLETKNSYSITYLVLYSIIDHYVVTQVRVISVLRAGSFTVMMCDSG